MVKPPAGLGRKHPQLDIPVSRLFLDPENPRLPQEAQGKNETELLGALYRGFALDELADSMAHNGYFDEEPMVAIPRKLPPEMKRFDVNSPEFKLYIEDDKTELIVVEGNRRLATVKLLLDPSLREKNRIKNWASLSKEVEADLSTLPVIIYKERSKVVPYLGVRHIVGIQKWEAYAKASYIAKLKEIGFSIPDIEALIGDQTGALVRNYICYKLLEQANEEFESEYDFIKAKSDFSLLLLAIGQGNIKRYIGLPPKLSTVDTDAPLPVDKAENLKNLLIWIFGGKSPTTSGSPVIRESRDITNYLSHVVTSNEAITYLKDTGDLTGAYDRTDGEEKMVLKYLKNANSKLETVLSIVHRHKTPDVLAEIEKCNGTVKALLLSAKDTND